MDKSSAIKGYWARGALLAACFWHCSENPVRENPAADSAIRYVVEIPQLPAALVHVRVKATTWEYNDSVRFLFPPVYADNPMLETTGPVCANIRLTGSSGKPIAFTTDSLSLGWKKSLILTFGASALPAELEYDAGFPFKTSVNGVEPFMDGSRGYLQGNYLFAIPFRSRGTVRVWRDEFKIRVEYKPAGQLPFYGPPHGGVHFRNAYELLFSDAALGGRLLYEGTAGRQQFRFVSLSKDMELNEDLIDSAAFRMQTLLEDITGVFGQVSLHPLSIIFGLLPGGGLEGMHVFNMEPPKHGDTTGNFSMVAAHEILHFWIGLRTGDYEDPWWKEGTAYYLGFLFARRNGLCTLPFMKSKLLADLSTQPDSILIHSLSSAYLRDHLFREKMYDLVYVKGAQVCLLLDRRIREVSGGRWTLDAVLGVLTRNFEGRAFYRVDYLGLIKSLTGTDVSDIFSLYVDTPGVIPDSVLLENWARMRELGAFDSPVVMAGVLSVLLGR